MKYILGVLGSEAFNLETFQIDFTVKIEISQEVYNWLIQHDIEREDGGGRVFICNKLRYKDLGPKIEFKKEEDVT